MPTYVGTSGTPNMNDGYEPSRPYDVVPLGYLNRALQGLGGNSQLLTTSSDIPIIVTGKPFQFQFLWLGNQSTFVLVDGYPEENPCTQRGQWTIPNPTAGSYDITVRLMEFIDESGNGREMDTLTFTLTVLSVPQDAQWVSAPAMPTFTYNQNALMPVELGGTGPFRISLESGSLQAGVALITTQLLTVAEAGITITTGKPTQEGAYTGQIIIGATGPTSVMALATVSVTDVVRPPTFAGLSQIQLLPATGSGAVSLAQFIKGYPVPSLTAAPALQTVNARLSLSGTDILYLADLMSIQGTSTPVTFTLDNGSDSASVLLNIRVATASTTAVPVPTGVIFSWSRAIQSATASGSEITFINDIAQGNALRMVKTTGFSGSSAGPTWDASAQALQFRTSAKSTLGGLGIDCGTYPHTIALRARVQLTTPTGTRQLYGGASQAGYITAASAGGVSTIAHIGSIRALKGGGSANATANTLFSLSLSSQPQGVLLMEGTPAYSSRIAGVTVSSASSGGATVPLTRVCLAQASNATASVWFLGSSVPALNTSLLWLNVTYDSTTPQAGMLAAAGVAGTGDLRILDAKSATAAAGQTPSITLSKSGVPSIAYGVINANIAVAASMSASTNLTLIVTTNDFGSQVAGAVVQTTPGSANVNVAYSLGSAVAYALAGVAVAEVAVGASTTNTLGIGVSAANVTAAISADVLYSAWSALVFHHRNASQGSVRVNSTVYSVSGAAVAGLFNDVYLGGATGADFDLRAVRITAGTFDNAGNAGSAETAWLISQDVITVPSVSAAPVVGILDTDPRITAVYNSWRANTWHTAGNAGANLYFITGGNTNGKTLASTPESGLLNQNFNGTANNKLVWTKTSGANGLDTSRTYTQLSIDDDTRQYNPPTEGTTRIGLGATYKTGIIGNIYWQGYDLVFDPSFYAQNSFTGTFNISLEGIHQVNQLNITGTPFTFYVQPNAAWTQLSLRITTRRHPVNNGVMDTTTREEITTILTQYPITAGKRYLIVIRYRLDGTQAQSLGGGFLTTFVRENATWLNGGNPILNYAGRLGYVLPDDRIEQRPHPHIYNWATQFASANPRICFPNVANGIMSSGRSGYRLWSSKGIVLREASASGLPAVNRLSVTGFMDSLTNGS